MAQNTVLENYTVALAEKQSKGRGQMDASWHSEPFKNLTFSTFTSLNQLSTKHKPYLNYAVSIAVLEVLKSYGLTNIRVKWPNDIMAGKCKICGILIETTFIGSKIKNVIIGIGLNVNQTVFPNNLPNPTSLKLEIGQNFIIEELLHKIVATIQSKIELLEQQQFERILDPYLSNLYEKNVPRTFRDERNNTFFNGMIKGVSKSGQLLIQLEDDTIKEFDIKEVTFAKF